MLDIITALTGYPYDPWNWARQVRIPTWPAHNNQKINPQLLIHSYTYDTQSRIRTQSQPPCEREECNRERDAAVGQRLEEDTNSNYRDLVNNGGKHSNER